MTIDADGVDNDSITVTLGISALGTGSPTIDWDQGSVTPEFDHNDSTFATAGEGISFATIGVTGTLSGGDALVVNSAKYTSFKFRRWAGAADELVSIDGDGAAYDWGNGAAAGDGTITPLDDTAFSITHISGGSWNGDHIGFTVDVVAVPEPSSTALVGLGGLALILRRRK
ncbi:PEP-CTERM sorting domain-containing protein [bacterium]|nr:PEP-CTERM sorting domain-containing protein [bacterium]